MDFPATKLRTKEFCEKQTRVKSAGCLGYCECFLRHSKQVTNV